MSDNSVTEEDSEDMPILIEKRIELKMEDYKRHNVVLFGSWNRFKGDDELEYQGKKIFATTCHLPLGSHIYRFLIDAEYWKTHNNAPKIVQNGTEYNQIHVGKEQCATDTKNDEQQLKNANTKLQQQFDDLLVRYKTETSLRRRYFNILQDMRGNVRIFCIVRPLLPSEVRKNEVSCIQFPEEGMLEITDDRGKNIKFEPTAPSAQQQIVDDAMDSIEHVMDGYNVSIFSYGPTGSGKTHTMDGIHLGAFQYLFETAKEREKQIQYKFELSLFEITNNIITDLIDNAEDVILNDKYIEILLSGYIRSIEKKINNSIPKEIRVICRAYICMKINLNTKKQTKQKKKTKHKVRHLMDGTVDIVGLTSFPVHCYQDIIFLNKIAENNRKYHNKCRVNTLSLVKVVGVDNSANIKYVGKLYLVDLMGSERVKKSSVSGQALLEAMTRYTTPNSLTSLGDVLQALQRKNKFIPYRNGVLTDLMSDALGGNSKVVMFINCIPTKSYVFETVSSLKYGQRLYPPQYQQYKTKKEKNAKKK